MNKKFTKLIAAFALLVGLMIPLGMWGQTTATINSFSATSGNIDQNISYAAYKGGASNEPFISNGNLRIYKPSSGGTGGYVTITAANGCEMTSVTITNSSDKSGTIKYSVDGGSLSSSISLSTNEAYTVNNISATEISFYNTGSDRLSIAGFSVVYTGGGTSTTYTVTFNAGDGTFVGNSDFPSTTNQKAAGTYALPSATRSGFTFNGWTTTGNNTPQTGNYTVSGPVDFTAQYTENSGSVTATLTATNLELTGSYTTDTEKTIDGITYCYTSLMKNNNNIQAAANAGTIKNTTAYPGDIISVKITHSGTARATTINGSADGTNWTQVATGSGSITADFSGKGYKYFQITRGSNAAYWTKIEITYSTTSLESSDLAITNASTELNFDLYNNNAAQTITYTTSSTGAITITPASPTDCFSYVHDAEAKTITVTPLAVTSSAQTVTISQDADETYAAGTATFTVEIEDSTPFEGSMFIFNTDEGLQALGISKPTNGSGTDLDGLTLTSGIVTMTTTDGGTPTRVWNSGGITDLRVYVSNNIGGSLIFTVPEGYAITKITVAGNALSFSGLTSGVWTASGDPVRTVTLTATSNAKVNTIAVEFEANVPLEILPNQWYLIASPIVNNVNPVDAGLITYDINNNNTSTFALYSFDQTESDEWRNYKAVVNGFDLVNGLGYLYANQTGCMLTFTGATPNGAYPIDCSLVYDDEADLPGYNLVGNPFATDAYLTDAERNFYVMSNGVVIAATAGSVIAPMQGIFVIAADADDDNVTFTTTAPDKAGSQIALNVTKNRGSVIDRAIVRMDEGRQLPKFQLFEDNTKLYIPQNGKDYAVVSAKGQGELPVNFRAAENGTYTLSIDAEDMDMNYLHLIDNMTGADINLLQTPSYTFEANVNDYESRFRLVFANASTDSTTDESFAFYSNGSLIVNNEGNATLQVVDLTGRILSSETISGSCSTSINAPTGVYMLRLINGDNVKVQKIVVR